MTVVGIVSTGTYIPSTKMSAAEIAERSGLPADVVKTKMGITEKPIPGEHDHTVAMGVWAARQALRKGQVDPKEIDVIIYIGEEHKEYPLWTAAIKMQEELGAYHAWAFDVALRCGTTIMAMKVAKSLMLADPDIRTVLLAGGYRNGDFIDYGNERTRFMFNLAAGGAAMILRRDHTENIVLEAELITDGSFSEDVVVPVGGTKKPLTASDLEEGLYRLDVLDPIGMKARLEQKSMENFLKVIRSSLQKSGFTEKDIDYLAILHMKKSAHDFVLRELGLNDGQSIYLHEYGHIGQMDQILSLELAIEENKLNDGHIAVLVSAGIGYAWGAITVKWGKSEGRSNMSLQKVGLKKVELANNEKIAYREREGGEQVVVLVHGNMTSSKHWDVLMDSMNTKYKIYAPDLRGFGESTYNERVTGIRDFSEDLAGFIETLELEKFHLVGWSTGGAVCMQFVADHPGKCEKLVLLASASTRGYPFFGTNEDGGPDPEHRLQTIEDVEQDAGKTLAMQGLYDNKNRDGLKAVWNALIYTHNQPEPSKYDEYVDDMLTQRNLADVYHSLNTFNISTNTNGVNEGTDQAKDIDIPVLVLHGDRDYVVSAKMQEEIMEDLGDNATFISLEDMGHSPLVDNLEKLKNTIESFLE